MRRPDDSLAYRLGILAALSCAPILAGCDQFYSFFGTVNRDYRISYPTGIIIGKVVDRAGKPVNGASVTDGGNLVYTGGEQTVLLETGASGSLAPGEYYLDKVPSDRVVSLRASFDGINSPTVQTVIPAFDPTKAVSTEAGSRNAPYRVSLDLVLPIDAPVDSADTLDSDGVFDSAQIKPLTTIQVATSSTGLVYTPASEVLLALHRPPGASTSLTVRNVQLRYLNDRDAPINEADLGFDPIVSRSLGTPVTFLPGTKIKSGPVVLASVPVAVSTTAFQNFLINGSGLARVEIKLRVGASANFVQDRTNGGDYRALVDIRLKR